MILLATVWSITMKYIINCIDLRSEVPWEDKSVWGLYVDLAAGSSLFPLRSRPILTFSHSPDFFKLINYVTFFSLILTFYGLPLNILRDVYITLRSFILKCRDLARYRAATRNMDTLYPDATLAEMDAMADKTCIICREDMEFRGQRPAAEGEEAVPPPPAPVGPNDTPKKLHCGHVFHFHCLRSWLERQQSCPTWSVGRRVIPLLPR
jgi:E3 ubiquitin-protein ligase synoviolin